MLKVSKVHIHVFVWRYKIIIFAINEINPSISDA